MSVCLCKGETGPQRLLQKPFEQGGHGAKPQRKQNDDVLCPLEHFLTLAYRCGRLAALKVRAGAQQREINLTHYDAAHFVAPKPGTVEIRLRQGMYIAPVARVRMAINDQNALGHKGTLLPSCRNCASDSLRRESVNLLPTAGPPTASERMQHEIRVCPDADAEPRRQSDQHSVALMGCVGRAAHFMPWM